MGFTMAAPLGAPFHGEFVSANANGITEINSRFSLYPGNFNHPGSALVRGANDQVIITDIIISSGAAILVQFYDGADNVVDNGERIIEANMAINSTFYPDFGIPHYCLVGTYPKVAASGAGQINCLIRGTIIRLYS